MLWKNEGMILAELLLSLGCLLMLGLFFTPLVIDLSMQTRKLQIEKQANQLLFNELQTFLVNPLSSQNRTTVVDGVEYQISLCDIADTGQKEVCVKIGKTRYLPEKTVCRFTE
jgi:hypothetical protein